MNNDEFGYATWTNNCTTTTAASIDFGEMLKTVRKFQDDQRRIDDGLIAALKKVFGESTEAITTISIRLAVCPFELDEYFEGKRPVSGRFWDAVRVWAGKERTGIDLRTPGEERR